MSYSGRTNYKSRREKMAEADRKLKVFGIISLIALMVYLVSNRVRIMDHIVTYF